MKRRTGLILFLLVILTMLFSACQHKHSYGAWQITESSTCQSLGTQERFCKCGKSQTERLDTVDHNYVNGICVFCNHNNGSGDPSINDSIPCSHTNTSILPAKAATCSENGLTEGLYCNDCKTAVITQGKIDKLPHKTVDVIDIAPTCYSDGYTANTHCIVCEEITEGPRAIAPVSHTYVRGVCTVCYNAPEGSEGLCYELLDDGTYKVTGIGDCTDENIVIPYSVNGKLITAIGMQAFRGCDFIKNVEILAPLTVIYQSAFENCTGLKSINMPSTLQYLDYQCFFNCYNIDRVYISDIVSWCSIYFEYSIHSTAIVYSNPLYYAKEMYIGNVHTTNLVIPEGITEIPDEAFCGTHITSLTLPATLQSIGDNAFEDCLELDSVYIDSVEHWLNIKFSPSTGGTGLETANPLYKGARLYANGELVEHVVIPEYMTEVPMEVFNGYPYLKTVYIHKNVEAIGDNAFHGCKNLISVTFEEGSVLKRIGGCAFEWCENLEGFALPNTVTHIDHFAFSSCNKINFTLPDSLVFVGSSAFPLGMHSERIDGCIYVGNWLISGYSGTNTTVTVREGTVGIAENAFNSYSNDSFTTIMLPASLKYICEYAFSEHFMLENIVFAENSKLEYIGPDAFNRCYNLKELVLPDSVTYIGGYAFYKCTSLERVKLSYNLEYIGYSCFAECTALNSISWNTPYDWDCVYYATVNEFTASCLTDSAILAQYLTTDYIATWTKKN